MLYRSTGLECSPNHIPFCLLTEIVVELPKCWKIRLLLSHFYLRCKERKEGSHLLDVCFRVSQTDIFQNGVFLKAFMVLCIVRETFLMCCLFLTHIPILYKLIDGKPLVPNLPVGCYEMPHKLRIDFLYHYVCFFFAPTVSFSSSFCQLRFL